MFKELLLGPTGSIRWEAACLYSKLCRGACIQYMGSLCYEF